MYTHYPISSTNWLPEVFLGMQSVTTFVLSLLCSVGSYTANNNTTLTEAMTEK